MTTSIKIKRAMDTYDLSVNDVLIASFTDGPFQRRLLIEAARMAARMRMEDEIILDMTLERIKQLKAAWPAIDQDLTFDDAAGYRAVAP
ncbi:MAG: hypothetical protein LC676_10825 [Loktanella sp.]|nr:hypothetical protein [Loktanella sp.]